MRASFGSETFNPDRLIAGDPARLLARSITLEEGQNLSRGAVLGRITASSTYALSATGAGDGSETPDLVLAEDTDASAGDVVTIAYERGDFDENEIVLGSGHTADSIREGLRAKGINLVPSTTD